MTDTKKKYFGSFENLAGVLYDFGSEGASYRDKKPIPDAPTEDEVLYAVYGGAPYEGHAIVIYERDGKLYEVVGSHCSCYCLEGQWSPEETTWAALAIRKLDPTEFEADALTAWKELIEAHQ